MTRTPPAELCLTCVDDIVADAGLAEVVSQPLTSPMQETPVGVMRIFTRGQRAPSVVAKAVYVGLSVEAIGMDSHMVFAFTDADSPVPHFTLDSVAAHGYHAFHLDLIPRVDLGANLAYIDHVFSPLTETFERVESSDGLSRAEISPRQRAIMSPWMFVHRATVEAFVGITDTVATYRTHWASMVSAGLPEDLVRDLDVTDLAVRDQRNRAALFSPDVDPVWNQITRLIGDQAEQIRLQLTTNEVL